MEHIGYKGIVNLKYVIKGREYTCVLHNNGTQSLFKFLCKCLCGALVNEERPVYIDVRTSESSTFAVESSIIFNKLSAVSPTYIYDETTQNWQTKFVATLSYNDLSVDLSTLSNNYFRLVLQNEQNTDYAYVDVTYEQLSQIAVGTQIKIEWSLYFDNIGE